MITGGKLLDAIVSGANNLRNNKNSVDELNIFPVPDGDTGTNMSMTISSACNELEKIKSSNNLSASLVLDVTASALLRGARGNSGVILSLLFKGLAEGVKNQTEIDGKQIIKAFSLGVESAYKAVMNPVEGTILTVARVAYEHANDASFLSDDEIYIWQAMCKGANKALLRSPELLPVLKKAGVVDAGGKGLCLILEGMLSVFKDNIIIQENTISNNNVSQTVADTSSIFSDSAVSQFSHKNIKFTYCTEFIVEKSGSSESSKDANALRDYLQQIGDCVLVVEDEQILKVHTHTNNPNLALGEGLKYGDFLKVKIENMKEQNRAVAEKSVNLKNFDNKEKTAKNKKLAPTSPTNSFGFVAVAIGEGIESLFEELGCNQIIKGGQTMNPSTANIAEAVLATPAKVVFILPNNKNVFLAAEQVSSIVKDRKVQIIPSKTIPQGICAMLAFNEEKTASENFSNMVESTKKVKTGQITYASRDSDFGGFKIKKDDILALIDGKLMYKSRNITKAVIKLIRSMTDRHTEFVTIIYGKSVNTEDAEEIFSLLQSKLGPKIEVSLIKGDQPIYHYIVSVE